MRISIRPWWFFLLWVIFKSLSWALSKAPRAYFLSCHFLRSVKESPWRFFSIGLCCFQHKGSRFILGLRDHYNIGSVASLCSCDVSLRVVASKETDAVWQEEQCHVSWQVPSAPWGIYEELEPQQRRLNPVITLSSLRQARGIQIIFRAWIRQDLLLL